MPPVILIHGPTASGKTQLAIQLAKRLGGEIINADAMQCYRDLDILTARPDAEEQAAAPHHLFGYVDAAVRHSAGDWMKEAMAVIDALAGEEKTPILVGGTGLYLSALTDGLSAVPPIEEAYRNEARAMVQRDPAAAWSYLTAGDPYAHERIHPQDRQRMARALEVLLATGTPISSFHGRSVPPLAPGTWIGLALMPRRESLYGRIDARVDAMMKRGALQEAGQLWERRLDDTLPVMRAHGMPGFCDYFAGRVSLDEAVSRCKRDTRRYAKRQMTWIAHQFTLWPRIPSEALAVRTRVIADMYAQLRIWGNSSP